MASRVGMASAVTFIVRQAGFAISIAALGLTLGAVNDAAEFAQPFALAALVALLGMIAALVLLPGEVPAPQHTSLIVTSCQEACGATISRKSA